MGLLDSRYKMTLRVWDEPLFDGTDTIRDIHVIGGARVRWTPAGVLDDHLFA